MMPIMRKFGSLYLDGIPCELGASIGEKGPRVEIKDSDARKISWVVVGNILVAQRELLVDISWNTLKDNGLIDNKDVIIDRLPYRIRLLHKGEDVEDLGEFQQYIDVLGEFRTVGSVDRRIWLNGPEDQIGFKPIVFRSENPGGKSLYDVRGLTPAAASGTAWLPALEPVRADLDKALENDDVAIWTTTGEFVTGRLVEISEYDLLLASSLCIAADGTSSSPWVREFGFCRAVDREGIWSLQLYNKGEDTWFF